MALLAAVANRRCCVRGNVCRAKLCVLPDEEPCGVAADGVAALRMCRLPTEFCADPAKGVCTALQAMLEFWRVMPRAYTGIDFLKGSSGRLLGRAVSGGLCAGRAQGSIKLSHQPPAVYTSDMSWGHACMLLIISRIHLPSGTVCVALPG
jgi:hypothetical protein